MKQKDKEVLLKTFCSLLLYNGYFSHCNKIHRLKTIELDGKDTINNKYPVEICYPYLRPMSSMTEEEREELFQIWKLGKENGSESVTKLLKEIFYKAINENYILKLATSFENWIDVMTWFNKHHFDYRGLIEKGLAIEAPERMYNIKTTCNNCEDKSYCSQSEYVKNNCYKLK